MGYTTRRMNEIEIYERIMGHPIKLSHLYKSPFRPETRPSLSFFRHRSGYIKWKDFGSGEPAGNIYDFVGKYINSTNIEAIKMFIYGSSTQDNAYKERKIYKLTPRKETNLEIKTKRWEQRELDYWLQFGIDKQSLKKFNVFPLQHYYINDIKTTNNKGLMFAEIVNDHVKVYRPDTPAMKWKSNVTKSDVFGLEQLKVKDNEPIVITKALKDVMVLDKLGYNAIAPQSETSDLSCKAKEVIKGHKIYVLFDNDETGLKRGKELAEEYGATAIFIPEEYNSKDISDLVRDHGIETAKEFLKNTIEG